MAERSARSALEIAAPSPLLVVAAAAAVALAVHVALGGLVGLCLAIFALGWAGGFALRRACVFPNSAGEQPAELRREQPAPLWGYPPAQETVGPFSFACHAQFAEGCGGDWWSIRQLARGRVLVVIGDVTGHGFSAALVAAHARGAVAALEEDEGMLITPSSVLNAVHRAVRAVGNGELLTTCFAMVLDPAGGTLDYANASHCFPYVIPRAEHGDLSIVVARGNPLGDDDLCVDAGHRTLAPGDVLVLHTDGLADGLQARAGRCGHAQLRSLLREQHGHSDGADPLRVRDTLRSRLHGGGDAIGAPFVDDLTVIVCQFSADGYLPRRATTSRCRVVETAPGRFAVLQEQVEHTPVPPQVVGSQQDEAEQAPEQPRNDEVEVSLEDLEIEDLEEVEELAQGSVSSLRRVDGDGAGKKQTIEPPPIARIRAVRR